MGLNFLSHLSNSRIDKESLKDLFHMYALVIWNQIGINEESRMMIMLILQMQILWQGISDIEYRSDNQYYHNNNNYYYYYWTCPGIGYSRPSFLYSFQQSEWKKINISTSDSSISHPQYLHIRCFFFIFCQYNYVPSLSLSTLIQTALMFLLFVSLLPQQ